MNRIRVDEFLGARRRDEDGDTIWFPYPGATLISSGREMPALASRLSPGMAVDSYVVDAIDIGPDWWVELTTEPNLGMTVLEHRVNYLWQTHNVDPMLDSIGGGDWLQTWDGVIARSRYIALGAWLAGHYGLDVTESLPSWKKVAGTWYLGAGREGVAFDHETDDWFEALRAFVDSL